jgi:hypothetical protein
VSRISLIVLRFCLETGVFAVIGTGNEQGRNREFVSLIVRRISDSDLLLVMRDKSELFALFRPVQRQLVPEFSDGKTRRLSSRKDRVHNVRR